MLESVDVIAVYRKAAGAECNAGILIGRAARRRKCPELSHAGLPPGVGLGMMKATGVAGRLARWNAPVSPAAYRVS